MLKHLKAFLKHFNEDAPTCFDPYLQPFFRSSYNERTSTEFNVVTVQSTVHEPPKNGRKYKAKHLGATSLK
jgi:hypothetical protein